MMEKAAEAPNFPGKAKIIVQLFRDCRGVVVDVWAVIAAACHAGGPGLISGGPGKTYDYCETVSSF
jgi:hypothetical protein